MSAKTRIIIFTALATLLVVVILQNLRPVALRLIVFAPEPPLAVTLAVFFGIGIGVGWLWKRL